MNTLRLPDNMVALSWPGSGMLGMLVAVTERRGVWVLHEVPHSYPKRFKVTHAPTGGSSLEDGVSESTARWYFERCSEEFPDWASDAVFGQVPPLAVRQPIAKRMRELLAEALRREGGAS